MAWHKVKTLMSGMADSLPDLPDLDLPSVTGPALVSALGGQDFRSLMTQKLTEWAESALGTVPTAYDKALDALYNSSHVGGKYHRLFDGSHDPFGAWQRITEAGLGHDVFDRVGGYAQALTKDFVTTMGIPFATLDKQAFDQMVTTWSAIPGIDRDYLYKLFSLNGADLIGATLSAVAAILAFNSENFVHFSELVGALGVSTIASANPLLAVVTIVSAGYGYSLDQLSLASLTKGAAATVMSLLLYSVISLPFLIEIVLVAVIVDVVKVNLFENVDLQGYIIGALTERWDALKLLPAGG